MNQSINTPSIVPQSEYEHLLAEIERLRPWPEVAEQRAEAITRQSEEIERVRDYAERMDALAEERLVEVQRLRATLQEIVNGEDDTTPAWIGKRARQALAVVSPRRTTDA